MPWGALVWLIIFIFRSFENDGSAASATGNFFRARGKVKDQAGPDMRSFRGRAGRREWWVTMGWSSIVGGIISGLIPTLGSLLALPWIVAGLAVTARRLHDLTLSAWWQVVPMAVASLVLAVYGIGRAAGMTFSDMTVQIGVGVIGAVYTLFYLWIGFAPGARKSNHFGEADGVVRAT